MDHPLPNPARFLNRTALWLALSAAPGAAAGQFAETQANEPLIRATLDPREVYHDVPGANPQNR